MGSAIGARSGLLHDEDLDLLAAVLDDLFRVPGTNIRFGLDPLIGLLPAVGDSLTGLLSFVFIFAGWQRGLPRGVLARMIANIAIDTIVGSVPIAGDAFDFWFKSHRLNFELLQTHATAKRTSNRVLDLLFLVYTVVMIVAIVVVPFAIVAWIFSMIWG